MIPRLDSLGLYLHVPFCARRCDYCDFFVVVGEQPGGQRAFFDWLRRDLEAAAHRLAAGSMRVDSIYIGGGTPSYVPVPEIAAMLTACRSSFTVAAGAEVTMEANPESVTPAGVEAWQAAGINRLSLGVQSFDDRVLGPRGRLYDAARAENAARLIRSGGIRNLGLDLIAGLPGETTRGFREGFERALALDPAHLSVYLIETDDALKETRLTREVRAGRERLAGEDEMIEMYDTAVRRAKQAGYRHYEISNLARPGLESLHNLKYWTGGAYLGVGPSAHSSVGGRRFGRPADLDEWISWIESGEPIPRGADYTLESAEARACEALTLELRLMDGVDLAEFSARWSYDPSVQRKEEIASLVAERLAVCERGRLRLTPRGILMANEALSRLM